MPSPVNILLPFEDPELQNTNSTPPLKFEFYPSTTLNISYSNDGNQFFVEVDPPTSSSALSAGHVQLGSFIYEWQAMTVRWRKGSQHGSEHAVNGHHFPAELQFFFSYFGKSSSSGGNSEEEQPARTVVVSVFLQLPEMGSGQANTEFNKIIAQFPAVSTPGAHKQTLGSLNPLKLLPITSTTTSTSSVFTSSTVASSPFYSVYQGSLSFPPCSGNTTYVVMHNAIEVTAAQLSRLSVLNFDVHSRPLQPLQNRDVLTAVQGKVRAVEVVGDGRLAIGRPGPLTIAFTPATPLAAHDLVVIDLPAGLQFNTPAPPSSSSSSSPTLGLAPSSLEDATFALPFSAEAGLPVSCISLPPLFQPLNQVAGLQTAGRADSLFAEEQRSFDQSGAVPDCAMPFVFRLRVAELTSASRITLAVDTRANSEEAAGVPSVFSAPNSTISVTLSSVSTTPSYFGLGAMSTTGLSVSVLRGAVVKDAPDKPSYSARNVNIFPALSGGRLLAYTPSSPVVGELTTLGVSVRSLPISISQGDRVWLSLPPGTSFAVSAPIITHATGSFYPASVFYPPHPYCVHGQTVLLAEVANGRGLLQDTVLSLAINAVTLPPFATDRPTTALRFAVDSGSWSRGKMLEAGGTFPPLRVGNIVDVLIHSQQGGKLIAKSANNLFTFFFTTSVSLSAQDSITLTLPENLRFHPIRSTVVGSNITDNLQISRLLNLTTAVITWAGASSSSSSSRRFISTAFRRVGLTVTHVSVLPGAKLSTGLRVSITNRLGQLRATSPAEVRGPIISNGVIGSPRFLSAGLLAGAPGSTLELEFVTASELNEGCILLITLPEGYTPHKGGTSLVKATAGVGFKSCVVVSPTPVPPLFGGLFDSPQLSTGTFQLPLIVTNRDTTPPGLLSLQLTNFQTPPSSNGYINNLRVELRGPGNTPLDQANPVAAASPVLYKQRMGALTSRCYPASRLAGDKTTLVVEIEPLPIALQPGDRVMINVPRGMTFVYPRAHHPTATFSNIFVVDRASASSPDPGVSNAGAAGLSLSPVYSLSTLVLVVGSRPEGLENALYVNVTGVINPQTPSKTFQDITITTDGGSLATPKAITTASFPTLWHPSCSVKPVTVPESELVGGTAPALQLTLTDGTFVSSLIYLESVALDLINSIIGTGGGIGENKFRAELGQRFFLGGRNRVNDAITVTENLQVLTFDFGALPMLNVEDSDEILRVVLPPFLVTGAVVPVTCSGTYVIESMGESRIMLPEFPPLFGLSPSAPLLIKVSTAPPRSLTVVLRASSPTIRFDPPVLSFDNSTDSLPVVVASSITPSSRETFDISVELSGPDVLRFTVPSKSSISVGPDKSLLLNIRRTYYIGETFALEASLTHLSPDVTATSDLLRLTVNLEGGVIQFSPPVVVFPANSTAVQTIRGTVDPSAQARVYTVRYFLTGVGNDMYKVSYPAQISLLPRQSIFFFVPTFFTGETAEITATITGLPINSVRITPESTGMVFSPDSWLFYANSSQTSYNISVEVSSFLREGPQDIFFFLSQADARMYNAPKQLQVQVKLGDEDARNRIYNWGYCLELATEQPSFYVIIGTLVLFIVTTLVFLKLYMSTKKLVMMNIQEGQNEKEASFLSDQDDSLEITSEEEGTENNGFFKKKKSQPAKKLLSKEDELANQIAGFKSKMRRWRQKYQEEVSEHELTSAKLFELERAASENNEQMEKTSSQLEHVKSKYKKLVAAHDALLQVRTEADDSNSLQLRKTMQALSNQTATFQKKEDKWKAEKHSLVDKYTRLKDKFKTLKSKTKYKSNDVVPVEKMKAFDKVDQLRLVEQMTRRIQDSDERDRSRRAIRQSAKVFIMKERPYLGVNFEDDQDVEEGMAISKLDQSGPCKAAGVAVGDVLLELNGRAMNSLSDFKSALKQLNPGDFVSAHVERKDKVHCKIFGVGVKGYSAEDIITIKRLADLEMKDYGVQFENKDYS